jgi:hypothetical protein
MLLTIATIAVLIVLVLFIWDTSSSHETKSDIRSFYRPFYAESSISHEYLSTPTAVWKTLIALDGYSSWFPQISRLLPDVNTQRYVHQFSFDQFPPVPGTSLLLRPNSWSPFYHSRVVVVDENKEISFDLKYNPFFREYVVFALEPRSYGTAVTCQRTSSGLFSFLSLWGFTNKKSKILDNLGYFIPEETTKEEKQEKNGAAAQQDPALSREATIAQAAQAGLDGNMDLINAIPDKPTRGLAKAALVQSKRKGGTLPEHLQKALSEAPTVVPTKQQSEGVSSFSSQEEQIAYLVNLTLDGNDEALNAVPDRVIRGKVKAMLAKIKRGALEKPPMPETSSEPAPPTETSSAEQDNEEQLILRLVKAGVDGNMDEINALDNKALRGKIKSAIVKEMRAEK